MREKYVEIEEYKRCTKHLSEIGTAYNERCVCRLFEDHLCVN